MSNLAYFRVSTSDQSIESQRAALIQAAGGKEFAQAETFMDEGVSGAIPAAKREGFAKLLAYAREGDTVFVYAVDRLGRDALDVQATVKGLLARDVAVHVCGLGLIAKGVGELIVAVLAQVANMEKDRIKERTAAGRAVAVASLAATGKTHKGKTSLGRPKVYDLAAVKAWREANSASIAKTAEHWNLSTATVKRALKA